MYLAHLNVKLLQTKLVDKHDNKRH